MKLDAKKIDELIENDFERHEEKKRLEKEVEDLEKALEDKNNRLSELRGHGMMPSPAMVYVQNYLDERYRKIEACRGARAKKTN